MIAATEESDLLIRPCDRICRGEEEIEEALQELCTQKTIVAADPLYKYVVPEGTDLRPIAHLAFSGRIYAGSFKDLFAAPSV